MRRRRLIAFVGLALALAAPAGATGQDGEVFVDPDSPTGVEYDIPLERARRDASSELRTREQPSRSSSRALFGEGISEPAAAAPEAVSGGDGTDGGTSKARRRAPAVPEPVRAAVLRPGAPEGGAGSSLLFGGVGLLVIALGVGGGMLLRRARG